MREHVPVTDSPTDPCRELLELMGAEALGGVSVDWEGVRASLPGLPGLPSDYQAFVERSGEGMFRGWLRVYRPGWLGAPADHYPEQATVVLEDWRGWRASGDGSYPYPLYPEPGGVLPWGWDRGGNRYLWLTGDADPDRWLVVWTGQQADEWRRFDGSMTQFLVAFLRGEVEPVTGPTAAQLARRRPYGGQPGQDEWAQFRTTVTVTSEGDVRTTYGEPEPPSD